jgi:outer membrane protein assembly factor BamB
VKKDLSVVVNNSRLLLGVFQPREQRSYISCYDLNTRKKIWSVIPPGDDQTGFRGLLGDKSVSASGKFIALSTNVHLVTCMDTETGRHVWQKTTSSGNSINALVVAGGEDCYVVSSQVAGMTRRTTVTKLALADGTLRWQTPLPEGCVGMDMLVAADEVIVSVATWANDPRLGNRLAPAGARVCILDRESGKLSQSLNPMEGQPQTYVRLGLAAVERRLWILCPQMVVGYGSKEE